MFIGLAFFATYFGAGNLIFPPMLGLQSGDQWGLGMIGMLASGVGLPILELLVLGQCGSVQKISDHVNKRFFNLFIGMIMLVCCCVSIPRTAAVGIEMGLQGVWSDAPYFPAVIVYFLIAFLFSKDRGSVLDKVGKFLTPVMTVILIVLVIKGAVDPIGTPGQATVDNAMLNTIKDKGYHGAQMRKVNLGAGLIAALCLCIVYGGLLFMGACVSSQYSTNIGNADLLLAIIRSSGGQVAIYGLCLSVVLACLTTAIGQVTAVADFFETATHGKLPYKILVMVVPVITAIVASFGLDTIVALTSPWFSFAYPIALVLMILGVFEKVIPNDGAFKGATYLTVVFAFADLPAQYGVHIAALDAILNKIPLYSAGFGWIVPAVAGFVAGLLLYARKGKSAQAV